MPVVLIGVLSAPPIYPTKSDPMGEVIEVMTCDKGLGLAGTATHNIGLYGIAAQYGFSFGPLRLIPQVGISHDAYGYKELPMGTQFGVGGTMLLDMGSLWIGVKYWHLSNAGLHDTARAPNTGMDFIGGVIGVSVR